MDHRSDSMAKSKIFHELMLPALVLDSGGIPPPPEKRQLERKRTGWGRQSVSKLLITVYLVMVEAGGVGIFRFVENT